MWLRGGNDLGGERRRCAVRCAALLCGRIRAGNRALPKGDVKLGDRETRQQIEFWAQGVVRTRVMGENEHCTVGGFALIALHWRKRLRCISLRMKVRERIVCSTRSVWQTPIVRALVAQSVHELNCARVDSRREQLNTAMEPNADKQRNAHESQNVVCSQSE